MDQKYEMAACFKKHDKNEWECKLGFKDFLEASQHINKVKDNKEKNICSVIIQYNRYIPSIFRSFYLKYILVPKVTIKSE